MAESPIYWSGPAKTPGTLQDDKIRIVAPIKSSFFINLLLNRVFFPLSMIALFRDYFYDLRFDGDLGVGIRPPLSGDSDDIVRGLIAGSRPRSEVRIRRHIGGKGAVGDPLHSAFCRGAADG